MKVVKINQIDEILDVLRLGGVIALPTDTAYALAADATNPEPVDKVFTIKQRKPNKLLSWFFSDLEQVKQFCALSAYQISILQDYLPGPYTFIVDGKDGETVGIRITDDSITQIVVQAFGKPLTATSANIAGQPPIRTVAELKNLPVDLIVDGGTITEKLSSTVVDITQKKSKILRIGLGKFPK